MLGNVAGKKNMYRKKKKKYLISFNFLFFCPVLFHNLLCDIFSDTATGNIRLSKFGGNVAKQKVRSIQEKKKVKLNYVEKKKRK